jgi:hypothetical protein
VLANALADAVAVALPLALPLALALGLTEEAALMGTAVEPAVADAPVAAEALPPALAVADASGEDVCCDRAAEANSATTMALTLNRSNTFFTLSTPFSMRSGAPRRLGHSPAYPFWGIVGGKGRQHIPQLSYFCCCLDVASGALDASSAYSPKCLEEVCSRKSLGEGVHRYVLGG